MEKTFAEWLGEKAQEHKGTDIAELLHYLFESLKSNHKIVIGSSPSPRSANFIQDGDTIGKFVIGRRKDKSNDELVLGCAVGQNGGKRAQKEMSQVFELLKQHVNSNLVSVKHNENKSSRCVLIDKENADKFLYILKNWKKLWKGKEHLNKMIELLKSNKQLVLTGAPGTGKTYTAKEMAEYIIMGSSEDEEDNGEFYPYQDLHLQRQLVQFHPSYDYTDFVEGLRPLGTGSNGELQFGLRNGSFKEFCRNAGLIERYLFTHSGDNVTIHSIIEKAETEKWVTENYYKLWFKWLEWLERSPEKTEKVNDLIYRIVQAKSTAESEDVSEQTVAGSKNMYSELEKFLPKFVFIIDEINRAELSKVFGELMYALEPDYRGIEGRIHTQYSAMRNEQTFFVRKDEGEDEFFVPSNVYIIGTMNDIDRSVEVFDFALRRRFAWYEVKANEVMPHVLRKKLDGVMEVEEIEEVIDRAIMINNRMSQEDGLGLGEEYHIGPAYFSKIALYAKEKTLRYERLWTNHIQPLLYEYVRGMDRNYKNKIEKELKPILFNGVKEQDGR